MVAAEVHPERLVFVEEMGLHTSLAPLYGYAPKGERLCLEVPRNRGIPMFFPVDTIPPQIHCQFIRNSLVIHRTMVLCSHQDAEVGGTEGKATETKIAMI